jgi:hypothetical protein
MVRSNHGQRYQTAQEALQILIPPPPPPPPPQIPPVPRRKMIQTLGLVGAGFGLAIVGERLIFNKSEENPGVSNQSGLSFSEDLRYETRNKFRGLRCTHKSSDPPKSPRWRAATLEKRGTLILVPPFLRGVRGDQNATRQLYKTSVYTAGPVYGEKI